MTAQVEHNRRRRRRRQERKLVALGVLCAPELPLYDAWWAKFAGEALSKGYNIRWKIG